MNTSVMRAYFVELTSFGFWEKVIMNYSIVLAERASGRIMYVLMESGRDRYNPGCTSNFTEFPSIENKMNMSFFPVHGDEVTWNWYPAMHNVTMTSKRFSQKFCTTPA